MKGKKTFLPAMVVICLLVGVLVILLISNLSNKKTASEVKAGDAAVKKDVPTPQASLSPLVSTQTTANFATLVESPTPPPGSTPMSPQRSPKEGMVRLPAGTFTMGCVDNDSQCLSWEKPAHSVTVSAFWMDQHLVTVAEYEKCVNAEACKTPMTTTDQWAEFYNWNNTERANHPVNGVTWHDANTYCRWRGKRLPTEAEYEFALRDGKKGKINPWGDSALPPHQYGNYADEKLKSRYPKWPTLFKGYRDGYSGTSPICTFAKSHFGLCDISGNVWEWCADWFDEKYYSSSPADNPAGPAVGQFRVLRGGGFALGWGAQRASVRYKEKFFSQGFDLGFRCVQDE